MTLLCYDFNSKIPGILPFGKIGMTLLCYIKKVFLSSGRFFILLASPGKPASLPEQNIGLPPVGNYSTHSKTHNRRLSPTRPTPDGVDRIFEQHSTTTLLSHSLLFCSHSVYGWVSCSCIILLLLFIHLYLRLGELWLFYFHYFFSFICIYGWVNCGCSTSTILFTHSYVRLGELYLVC